LRILFAGTPANAAKTLEALVHSGHTIAGVLTRLDAALGRDATVSQSPVGQVAASLGIPVWKSNAVDEATLDWISKLEIDLGVIVAYGCILKKDALEIPMRGWINLHYSLLPKYPGASPVQQAILEGEKHTGVTVFALNAGIDSGPILSSQQVEILPEENAGELMERLSEVGSNLLKNTLDGFDNYYSARQAQNTENRGAVTTKITRAMAKLDFRVTPEQFVNKVRAMNPEPVAWFELDSLPVRVLESAVAGSTHLAPGVARLIGTELVVGCMNGLVSLKTVQPAGKKAMPGADWFRGLHRDSLFLS
jgi:methionyl-tRNA formyltransferase